MSLLVSVIIPVYNVERYLSRCVDSVLAQTYNKIEIIIINDGSPDACPEICDEYARNNFSITVVHQKNKGLAEARNTGLSIARGQYVYFLDSDDYICKDAIEILAQKAGVLNLDVVMFDATTVDAYDNIFENGTIEKWYIRKNDYSDVCTGIDMFRSMLSNGEYTCLVQLLFIKRDFLSHNKLSFYPGIMHDDQLFTLQSLMKAKRVAHINSRLFFRRWHSESNMAGTFNKNHVLGYCTVVREIIASCDNLEDSIQHYEFAEYVYRLMETALSIFAGLDSVTRENIRQDIFLTLNCINKSEFILRHDNSLLAFSYDFHINFSKSQQFILYGAGKKCKELLQVLMKNCQRMPDFIWDKAANDIVNLEGIPVSSPNFELLVGNKTVFIVVCIINKKICDEVINDFNVLGANNVYSWRMLSAGYIKALK